MVLGTVAGTMKSGTSWLMNLLDDHPQIVSRGEMHLLGEPPADDPIVNLLAMHHLGRPNLRFTLESILSHCESLQIWLRKGNDFWRVSSGIDVDEYAHQMQQDLLRLYFERAVSHALAATPKRDVRAVVEKSPLHHADHYERFNETFGPYRRVFVHLVRDPRDVAVSRWHHLRQLQYAHLQTEPNCLAGDDREACREFVTRDESQLSRQRHFFTVDGFLRRTFQEWSRLNRSMHEASQRGECPYVLVRYEDLKRDCRATLGRVVSLLGVDPARLPATPPTGPVTAGAVVRPQNLRKGTGGEWRRWFTEEDHALVREECGEVMNLFGYACDER
jgi:hypothetical protein